MSEGDGLTNNRPERTRNWRLLVLGTMALLGIGVLVALIVIQSRTDAERDQALQWQRHSYEVIIRAGLLSGAIGNAEAELGRYVVSAERTPGRQFSERWSQASDHLKRLATMTADNPEQRARMRDLQRAFDARGKELVETALYSVFKRNRDALGAYYRVRETPARMRLEQQLNRVIAFERGLLAERSAEAADLVATSAFATRVLTAFGMLIVLGCVLLGWVTIEAQGERAAADAEASAERIQAEELRRAVADATAQLREEAQQRERAQEQLRQVQKMEAVGQLTGGIAHDFNNMLAVVLGGLELAKRHLHTGGPQAQRHIENAMEGANRAAALTRRLLAFSRSEPLLPEPVDAGAVIRGMSDLLDRTLGDTIAVQVNDETNGWTVWVDRHQLENALLNLAVNARDAMEGRGTLVVTTGQRRLAAHEIGECDHGDYVTVAVSDTGCGMPPDVLDRVFEPFFTTKPVGKGTGLGMSQIFGFVRQSGGEIGIETGQGLGTTVTLFLPRYLGEGTPAGAEAPGMAEPQARALDILVVEDDPRVLTATIGALEELGHRAVGCDDPLAVAAALERLDHLDLIVSDVLMPGQTGPEMIAALEDRLARVAVLFVTGYAGETDAATFSGRPVLRKPFTIAALARAVDDAMAQATPQPCAKPRAEPEAKFSG